jgi:hypothetical protein
MNYVEVNMVLKFTGETPVLNFGARKPKSQTKMGAREFLLWPAWAYRVVAPIAKTRPLNIFQRAVMGLCRAGQNDSKIIGEKLAIHSDLAAFVLVELIDGGLLNRDGFPTDKGIQVMTDDSYNTLEMFAGYVFQDPWNGELWPRFIENLDYCELEYTEGGFPKLVLGSKGKPWKQNAFLTFPKEIPIPSRPSPVNVVSAVAGHKKGVKYVNTLGGTDDELEELEFHPSLVDIDRVSFIEEDPSPVFLMTFLYLEDENSGSSNWHVCDPFGFGASVRLRRRVEQIMHSNKLLLDTVDRLVGRGIHAGLVEHKQWLGQVENLSIIEVEKWLSVNIKSHVAFEHIVDMEFARQEILLLESDRSVPKIQEVLRRCTKCLEIIFGEFMKQYPNDNIWQRVYVKRIEQRAGITRMIQLKDREMLAAIYLQASTNIGFEDIPCSFLSTRPGVIRSVVEYKKWVLRPLIMATILIAERDFDHPIRKIAQRSPRLLNDIEKIANRGGKAGHASDNNANIEDWENTVNLTYSVISALTGTEVLHYGELSKTNEVQNGEG